MELTKGMVVFSTHGHDSDRFYIITATQKEFVYIVDGKNRTLEKPKRKNKKHLKGTKTVGDIKKLDTNKKIRQFLWSFNYGDEQPNHL